MNPSLPNTSQRVSALSVPAAVLLTLVCVGWNLALAREAEQRVYECNQGGQVIFSDQPCDGQERQLTLEYDQPSQSQTQESEAAAQSAEAAAGTAAEANLLDIEILNAEKGLSRLEAERDAQVAGLKAQRDAGSENLDENTWLAQMNAKIESTYQDYTDQILTERTQLDALRARRAALGGPVGGPGPQ
jgi:hypothetical protein